MNGCRNTGASGDDRDLGRADGTGGAEAVCKSGTEPSRSRGRLMDEERGGSSSPSSAPSDASSKTCVQCGTPIETGEWYPITADRDSEGSLRLHPFCTEDCQATWLDERSE